MKSELKTKDKSHRDAHSRIGETDFEDLARAESGKKAPTQDNTDYEASRIGEKPHSTRQYQGNERK